MAALLTWLVADPVLGVDLEVLTTPGGDATRLVSAGAIVSSTIIVGLLGWALLAVLQRISGRGTTIWRWTATTVALLSLAGPLTLAQTTAATVVLTVLHVVVAAILLVALPVQGSAGRK
ncbi:hypothetical protein FNH13_04315 [Ornithinimicrobium ciconiae]|uniref:Uncharacterized protein n=1 Tax=Ornithinimicrobium ciconiae TaxID=2594265 RepID=A0A516G805_9MICO|nr:hypothetical protein FNH13_04315 [Ornithinimicrobium ciconiae]